MAKAIKRISNEIAFGFAIIFTLTLLGFGISLYIHQEEERSNRWVVHTYQVIEQLKDVEGLVGDAETGIRGYTLASETTFLQPYQLLKDSLPVRLQGLRQLVSDNPGQIRRVDRLQRLTQERLLMFERLLQAANRNNRAEVTSLVIQGRQASLQLRRWIDIMTEVERMLLGRRDRDATQLFWITNITSVLLLLFTFLLLVVGYRHLRSELERRERNEAQLRAYEISLRENLAELQRSNEDLQRFAAVASHDLQEPLRKIQTYTSLIKEAFSAELSANVGQYLNRIEQAASRSGALIRDLLVYSRVSNQKENFQSVDLQLLVKEILEDLELTVSEQEARVDVGPLPQLEAMPGQMRHLFQNLLSNALKYRRPEEAPRIQVEARRIDMAYDEVCYEIRVTDNGIGFDQKYAEQIFEPFQRLHTGLAYKGTGIGLAICKKVITSHGGSITATSQPGQGTSFVLVLPERRSILKTYLTPAAP